MVIPISLGKWHLPKFAIFVFQFSKCHFQIWICETLEKYGFKPEHAPYYIVLLFDPSKPFKTNKPITLKEKSYTYVAKIRPLSEFVEL